MQRCYYLIKFFIYFSDSFTDDVLEAHEGEVIRVAGQLQTLRPIITSIQRREQILVDKSEYDEMLKNANRYPLPPRMIYFYLSN